MVKLNNNIAKRNSQLLMQRAMSRRSGLCSHSSDISARQTTKRFVPTNPSFRDSVPKLKIDSPKICKPN